MKEPVIARQDDDGSNYADALTRCVPPSTNNTPPHTLARIRGRTLPGNKNKKGTQVDFCHQHNLVQPEIAGTERRYGIRVSLPTGDTFQRLLGEDWEALHWYRTESERDVAFEKLATRHGYYRTTDSPTQILEKLIR